MSENTEYKVDRTGWGAGPWDAEPDRVEWEYRGMPCLAVRNQLGNWCGYAAVNPGHPWHGVNYSGDDHGGYDKSPDAHVTVHGGLTYSGACQGHICHVPKPGEPDDVWWFGFDCGHAGDYSPSMARYRGAEGYPKYQSLCFMQVEKYRTLDYVKAQVEKLADQLLEVRT